MKEFLSLVNRIISQQHNSEFTCIQNEDKSWGKLITPKNSGARAKQCAWHLSWTVQSYNTAHRLCHVYLIFCRQLITLFISISPFTALKFHQKDYDLTANMYVLCWNFTAPVFKNPVSVLLVMIFFLNKPFLLLSLQQNKGCNINML